MPLHQSLTKISDHIPRQTVNNINANFKAFSAMAAAKAMSYKRQMTLINITKIKLKEK